MGLFDKIKKAFGGSSATDEEKSVGKKIVEENATEKKETKKQKNGAKEPIAATVNYEIVTDFELEELEDGTYKIIKFIGFTMPENLIVPVQIGDKRISQIGDGVFNTFPNIKNVEIQEGISYIGESCFKECKELVKVSLPSELSVISKELFCECEKLQEINIPQNLISVEDKGFYGCSRLKIAALPETIENIGNNAFYACHNLGIEENDYQLILPKNLQTIGESAFEKSGGYRYVFIPASVKKIDKYAFKEMGTSECEIVIERGCSAELPLGMFYQLYLQKLSIPDSVTKIGGIFIAKDTVYSSKFVKDEYGRQVYDEYGKEVIKVNTSEDYMEEFSEELIICCEPGSAAMDFAREKNIQCEKYEN